MDQLICASLSHTHYWHEVGIAMLKVVTLCVRSVYDITHDHAIRHVLYSARRCKWCFYVAYDGVIIISRVYDGLLRSVLMVRIVVTVCVKPFVL